MNKKIGAVALLALMFLAVALTPLAIVFGQNTSTGQNTSPGIQILMVAPLSNLIQYTELAENAYNGTTGEVMDLQGTIYTTNGSFQVILGQNIVSTGTANGYYVNTTFTVPSIPGGSYDLSLNDVALNVNSTGTTPESFLVLTGYYVTPVPSQGQEGSSVVLDVSVTGGDANTPYVANVSVVLPGPLYTVYSTILSLGTSDQDGSASAQVTYSENSSSFTPSGSTVDYTGTYAVYFNASEGLGLSTFSVGFLNSTIYHRGDTVTIGATGYPSLQPVTLSIINDATDITVDGPQSLTASADGIINYTWTVPSNTVIGDYNVTITGIQKAIQDVETFSVPGYSIQVETVNLANEIVPQIQVQASDVSGTVYNGTSGSNGIVDLMLESGTYPLTAFLNDVNVGETTITVTGNATFTMQCQLDDLQIIVQNENGVPMPFVNLTITYQYQPAIGGPSQTGNVSGQTDTSGSYILNSTLSGINYNINASLYNQVFNSGNNTVNNLPAQALYDVVIICPNEALTLNVVSYNQTAIPDASISLVELTSGLFYTATTDSSGSASSQVTFGMYKLQIYKDNILINETKIAVFNNSQQQIICTLYGIQVSVSVVDFFGTPISNANVTLNGPGTERFSAMTQGDGTATFNDVIGGDMQIVAFAQGAPNNYQAETLTIDQPTSVQIRMDGYIVLGSLLVPASSLITLIIILVVAVLFATLEIYRRKIS